MGRRRGGVHRAIRRAIALIYKNPKTAKGHNVRQRKLKIVKDELVSLRLIIVSIVIPSLDHLITTPVTPITSSTISLGLEQGTRVVDIITID